MLVYMALASLNSEEGHPAVNETAPHRKWSPFPSCLVVVGQETRELSHLVSVGLEPSIGRSSSDTLASRKVSAWTYG